MNWRLGSPALMRLHSVRAFSCLIPWWEVEIQENSENERILNTAFSSCHNEPISPIMALVQSQGPPDLVTAF